VSGGPVETPPERTVLSWRRTGLGVVAVGGLLTHSAFVDGEVLPLLLGGLVALLGIALLGAVPSPRYRRLRRAVAEGTDVAAPRLAALVTGVVALAALAASCVVLVYS
jgi:putative membrane protein